MDKSYLQKENESYMDYGLRLISIKVENNPSDLQWANIVTLLDLDCHPDSLRKASNVTQFSGYNVMKWLEKKHNERLMTDEYFKKITEKERSIQLERIKLQDEKREHNAWLREQAREDAFEEKVIKAIQEYMPSPAPISKVKLKESNRCGVLSFADCHFGKDFTIYDLFDEILNQYNPEVFYARMNRLLAEVIEIVKKECFTSIKVFNLGDSLDGFLRHSQIWTLRYGVVDSAIIFGNFIGNWLRELSKHVFIEYHDTFGNHGECRLLDGRKSEHLNDNIEKVVRNCIQLINQDNQNIQIISNKTGLIYTSVAGYTVLGIHGEISDLAQAMKEFSDIYNVSIDYIFAGHKHYSHYQNCGVKKGVIGVGSIVGSDDYSMKLRKHADASALFTVFEENKGKIVEYTIPLDEKENVG